MNDQHAVACNLNVEFKRRHLELDRRPEASHRVFRIPAAITSVPLDVERASVQRREAVSIYS